MKKDIKNVELFLFDLDGTTYIGGKEIDGAFDAINHLRSIGKSICFFTNNSSRNHDDYVKKINDMGLEVSENEVYTSGQVTAEYILENFLGKKVYLLGNERLRKEFEDYGIPVVDENPDLCVIAFDTSLAYDRLYQFCKYVKKGLPYIATHPDFTCPAEECPMPDIGAMIEMVRLTTGRTPDVIMGKPHTEAGLRMAKNHGLTADKVAMVGDRLYTDIAFGNNCGFVSVLVLTGETDRNMLKESPVQPDYVLDGVRDIPKAIANNN
ncbi:MAG: HAD-IIA family hydrolase [Clostridia bacterium]|nr:HAD-IIA family hydrolase [Clostridia bacterium]